MKKSIYLLLISLLLLGCADVTPINECITEDPYGFFSGIWHGVVAPFAFIGSLFSDTIALYAINNTGGWYDFGFVLGAGILSFSSSKASKRK